MIQVILNDGGVRYICDNVFEAIGLKSVIKDADMYLANGSEVSIDGTVATCTGLTTLKKAPDPVPQPTSEVPKKEATAKPVETEQDKKRKRYLRDTLKKAGKTYPRGTTLETLEADYLAAKPEDDLVASEPKTEAKEEDVFSAALPDDNDGDIFGEEDKFEGGKPVVKEISKDEMRTIIIGVLSDDNNDITNVKAKDVLLKQFKVDKLDELPADKRAAYLEALGVSV